MPPRIGSNGAIIKHTPSASGQRSARPIASKIIELTSDSSDDALGRASEEAGKSRRRTDSQRGRENTSAGTRRRNAGTGQDHQTGTGQDHQRGARPAPGFILEDSFIVTSVHHRPWGAGDDNSTIGVFPNEKEAADAAESHFGSVSSRCDGWESVWLRCPGDGMLQLCGTIEEGENDTETYKASIQPYQQKRPIATQPMTARPSGVRQTKKRTSRPRQIYIVKQEHRVNVGEDDPEGFYNELGDLRFDIRGIYLNLDDANDTARRIYDQAVEDVDGKGETVIDTLKNGMARIVMENLRKTERFSIRVEQDWLQ